MFPSCLTYMVVAAAACFVHAAVITEDFSRNPLARGWTIFGDTNLFRWNAESRSLEVTWDSSRPNSYFQLPLGTIVSKSDDFSIGFDLRVDDIAIGTSSNRPDTFEIAVGFVNSVSAINTNYFRGAGVSAAHGIRNTVEFDYFPATGAIDATFAPTVISSNNLITFSDNHPLELTTNDLFHIAMAYTASNQVLKTSVMRNGQPYGLPPNNTIADLSLATYPDFRVDRLAIINYSDAVQFGPTQYWGSILAHGTIEAIVVAVPDSPVSQVVGMKSNATFRVRFASRTNWWYAMERTSDFTTWIDASETRSGTGGILLLGDTNAIEKGLFYRVKAMKP